MSYEKDFFDMYYRVISGEDPDPFTTQETVNAIDRFHQTHINPVFQNNREHGMNMNADLDDVVITQQRQAFEVGFRAAVRLINDLYGNKLGGGQQ